MARARHEHRFVGPGGIGACALVYDDAPTLGLYDVLGLQVSTATARGIQITVIDVVNGRRSRTQPRNTIGDINLSALGLKFTTHTTKHLTEFLWFPVGTTMQISWLV